MEENIYKYTLNIGRNVLDVGHDARWLAFAVQRRQLVIWARVPAQGVPGKRILNVHPTGGIIQSYEEYIGTCEDGHGLIWHAFEEKRGSQ